MAGARQAQRQLQEKQEIFHTYLPDSMLSTLVDKLNEQEKKELEQIPLVKDKYGELSASPQVQAGCERGRWQEIWQRHRDADAPWRCGALRPIDDPHWTLEPITVQALREVAGSFAKKKGHVGFHPRHFSWVSDETLAALAALLHLCEEAGVWPAALQHIVIHLIPKRDGGRRPIGLLESVCRIWERTRKPVVQAWRKAHRRRYDGCAKGRRVEDVVWIQALRDELARTTSTARPPR